MSILKKYKQKPRAREVVEAVQYTKETAIDILAFAAEEFVGTSYVDKFSYLHLPNLGVVRLGNYLLKGQNGVWWVRGEESFLHDYELESHAKASPEPAGPAADESFLHDYELESSPKPVPEPAGPAADEDGWIPWTPTKDSKVPVRECETVQVAVRANSSPISCRAGSFDWSDRPTFWSKIYAYRVCKSSSDTKKYPPVYLLADAEGWIPITFYGEPVTGSVRLQVYRVQSGLSSPIYSSVVDWDHHAKDQLIAYRILGYGATPTSVEPTHLSSKYTLQKLKELLQLNNEERSSLATRIFNLEQLEELD